MISWSLYLPSLVLYCSLPNKGDINLKKSFSKVSEFTIIIFRTILSMMLIETKQDNFVHQIVNSVSESLKCYIEGNWTFYKWSSEFYPLPVTLIFSISKSKKTTQTDSNSTSKSCSILIRVHRIRWAGQFLPTEKFGRSSKLKLKTTNIHSKTPGLSEFSHMQHVTCFMPMVYFKF